MDARRDGRVTVEIGGMAGRELIRVIDNGGRASPPGELPLAFASHATSKAFRPTKDLSAISTMGISRRRQLASIGAGGFARREFSRACPGLRRRLGDP